MEALTIVHHVPDYPIVDEIRGVKEFHSTRQVPLFLTFGVEITLDIHHVVGDTPKLRSLLSWSDWAP